MESITVDTSAGALHVRAEVIGNLAVHQLQRLAGVEGWRVTHVPTGCAIVIGIAERDDAIECAAQLNQLHSWDFKCEPQGAKTIIGDAAAIRVREIGESCGGLVASRQP